MSNRKLKRRFFKSGAFFWERIELQRRLRAVTLPFLDFETQMKHFRSILLSGVFAAFGLTACALGTSSEDQDDYNTDFDRSDWIADFETLKSELEISYPNLMWKASTSSDIDLPALAALTEKSLREATSETQAYYAIEDFIYDLEDGHVGIRRHAIQFEPTSPRQLHEFFDSAPSACAALGYIEREGGPYSIPFEHAGSYTQVSDRTRSSYRVGVVEQLDGRKVAVLRVGTFISSNFVAACEAQFLNVSLPVSDAEWPRYCGPKCDSKLREAVVADSFNILQSDLDRAAAYGADTLLIDIAGNPGGESWSFELAELFVNSTMNRPRVGVVSDGRLDRYLSYKIERLTEESENLNLLPSEREKALDDRANLLSFYHSQTDAAFCDLSWVWEEKRSWSSAQFQSCGQIAFAPIDVAGTLVASNNQNSANPQVSISTSEDLTPPIWNGSVNVFIDRNSVSAAELFAGFLQDSSAATIIGEQSLGAGCGFVDYDAPITLPRTGIIVTLPDCTILRMDGTNTVRGVIPDVELEPNPLITTSTLAHNLLNLLK